MTGVLAACSGDRPAGSHSTPHPSASGSVPATSLSALSGRLSSPLWRPGSAGYAAHVRLYNPRFDAVPSDAAPGPAAIAACRTPADVAACVRFAAAAGMPLHLRAGGHSYGGWSSGPGLVVNTTPMSSVVVDTAAHTVRVGAGADLAHVYEALARKGVAVAAGSCPTVGITGLTLGGGVGVLTRDFGLTCDAVQAVELVTADGTVREVDARRDPDLFWALRGAGGGSFGAVTALTLAVRPAPVVHTFYLSWDLVQGQAVLGSWQDWTARIDRRLWSTCKLLADPGRGGAKALVAGTWLGPGRALEAMLAPLLARIGAPPATRQQRTLSYAAAMLAEAGCPGQTADRCVADALTPTKQLPFAATSALLSGPLPETALQAAVRTVVAGLDVPHLVEGGMSFDALGGTVADVAPTGTPFVHRTALAIVQYTATWTSAGQDPTPFDAHVRRMRAELLPWTGTSAYVNYADPSLTDYATAYWGGNYPRLQAVKKQYDPGALFTFPQAVRPT